MKMINAVYGALNSDLACEGLAIAFLTLLAEPAQEGGMSNVSQRERQLRVKKIRTLLRHVASALGSKFDGCGLIQWLLSFDVNAKSWSLEDEEDKARLMYECVTLLAPPLAVEDPNARHKGQRKLQRRRSDEKTEEEIVALRSKLTRARKLLLEWCCTEYAPRWQARHRKQIEHEKLVKQSLKRGKDDEFPTGAGAPDFRSVLDGEERSIEFKECLDIMRCVLVMVDANSAALREFLYPGDPLEVTDPTCYDAQYRIQQCYEYGSDLDDEMLWIILKAAALSNDGIDPSLALSLIENLFECCNKDRKAILHLTDSELIWELYRLAEYHPSSLQNDMMETNGYAQNGTNIPHLAHPGMWWRITMLALVMCGVSPEEIGIEMWNAHPTLRALIKMVTSGRYRFPTIDCDEANRNEMKSAETNMREEVSITSPTK
jgi:integrator complex subunit 1